MLPGSTHAAIRTSRSVGRFHTQRDGVGCRTPTPAQGAPISQPTLRLLLRKPPNPLQQLRLDLVGDRPCAQEIGESGGARARSAYTGRRAAFTGEGASAGWQECVPRPFGMISAVSCSTVMFVSPLLRISSVNARAWTGQRGWTDACMHLTRMGVGQAREEVVLSPMVYSLS